MKYLFASLVIALSVPAVLTAQATSPARPAEDVARDAARRPADMITFAGIKPGSQVADMIPGGGYFTRVFAVAAGPTGKVIAIVPPAAEKLDPASAKAVRDLPAQGFKTVSVVGSPAEIAPGSLDVFWTAQNYHDLHNALPPEGVIAFNKAVLAALKPGGVYMVVDHAAIDGSGLAATKTLHRIDPAVIIAEAIAAGFKGDGSIQSLRNYADPRTANVFDPAIRGKTDQVVYRFRKP